MILILAGFVLVLFVIVVSMGRATGSGGRGGAVVIIGPFPIIFGSDKQSVKVLLALSIILVTLLIVLFLIQGDL